MVVFTVINFVFPFCLKTMSNLSNAYVPPQLKAEIKKSWRRLFDDFHEEKMDVKDIQGASWCLKKEWISAKK